MPELQTDRLGSMVPPEDAGFTSTFKKHVALSSFQRVLGRTLGFASNCLPPTFPHHLSLCLPSPRCHSVTLTVSLSAQLPLSWGPWLLSCLRSALIPFALLWKNNWFGLYGGKSFLFTLQGFAVCMFIVFLSSLGDPIVWPSCNPCFLFLSKYC